MSGAEVIAHNDLAPYNTCFAGDRLAGVFAWDLAAPSTRRMELAQIAWTSVPLFRSVALGRSWVDTDAPGAAGMVA